MNRLLFSGVLAASLLAANAAWADCPQLYAQCAIIANGICNTQGTTYVDSCWSWPALECEPCAHADDECNAAFPSCHGDCTALSTDQSGAICNQDAARAINPRATRNGRYIRLKADEALVLRRQQRELQDIKDSAAVPYLRQRQAYELRLLHRAQSDALRFRR